MLGQPRICTYAEATWTQTLPGWTSAVVRMFRFFGGAPKLLVPDDTQRAGSARPPSTIRRSTGPTGPWRRITRSASLPARPGKPRDKAKVEAGVRSRLQTYILGRLRGPDLLLARRMQRGDRASSCAA